ncbi:peptidase M50 family [methanogenic archaeon mixed culture ISO4-G1]|nr:peptidase M50 family [methanogenic archaeon mixed culture ISO4-G1]
MDTATLVMILLCIVYIPIWVWTWRKPEAAARFHLVKYGPAILIKTQLGIRMMDKLGRYKRFWRVFGFISKLTSALLFFMMMYMLVLSLINLPARIGQGGMGIQYALAIPGFNPMLPLTYGILALFIAMVVHEMGHGIQSRANDCKVDATGLLYGVVPLGAFCEPNEQELAKLDRRPQMDIYSAGITINTFVAVIAFLLLLFIAGGISPALDSEGTDLNDKPGIYYIDDKSPAFDSEIPTSSLITGIKLQDEAEYKAIRAVTFNKATSFVCTDGTQVSPLNLYNLQYVTEGGVTHDSGSMQMGALIKRVTNNSPASSIGIEPLTYIVSITIIDASEQVTVYDIASSYDFMKTMSETKPGDRAVIETVAIATDLVVPAPVTHEEVTLTSSGSQGYLGLAVTDSGFTFTTPSIMLDRSLDPFYGCTTPFSYVQGILSYLSGPFNGMDPIPDSITWWYDAPNGDMTWVILKSLYWIFWLDLLLAISNALPAYPFDGGFLFEGGINWLLERLGIRDGEKRKQMSQNISSSISTVTLVMFILVIMAVVI